MAEALYRKYRPQIFEDVVGQDRIERTLKNAIAQDKVSHAYLFTGPRGTGKTTTARLLAKALLCESGPTVEPDGTCEDCQEIAKGTHPDVYELDAASRTGVENVREEIIGRVQFAPTRGRSKVYIIDEVHMLSTAAFNALLKTLEEPPDHVVFILCTTDPQKVPETIHSRCQRFDFRRISAEAIVSRLGAICIAENVEFDGDALDLIAHRAEGGMRNALTSLEQVIAFGEGKVTLETAERLLGSLDSNDMAEIVTAIGRRDIAGCFVWTSNYIESGADLAQFTQDLAEHIRNMYVLTLAGTDAALEISEATRRELTKEMELFGADRLARMLLVLGDLSGELKTSTNPRLSFEIALTRMTRPDSDLTLASLAERVEALENGYSAVAHVVASPMQPEAAAVPEPRREAAYSQAAPITVSASTPSQSAAFAEPSQVQQAAQPAAFETPQPQQAESFAEEPASPMVQQAAASVPAHESTKAAAGGFSNPAALQRIWQKALASIKKEKAAYGALFLNTKATYDEASREMVISFPAANTFAYTAVQKTEVMTTVEGALQQAAGAPVPFRYEQGGKASSNVGRAALSQQPQQPQQPVQPQPQPQPAQVRQSQPQPAQAQVQAQPQPQPVVQDAPSDDDLTPLEAYEGIDMGGTWGEEAAPTPLPAAQPTPVPAAEPASAASAAQAPSAEPVPEASPAAAAEPAPMSTGMEEILAAGFGEGVTFEEVD